MPEALSAVLADPSLIYVCTAALLAGMIYGFAGFGSALVFMPLSTLWLDPAIAVAAFALSAISSLVTIVPSAWKVADRRSVMVLVGMSMVTTPLGVMVLRFADVVTLQTAIALVTLFTLAVLILGWRVPVGAGWRTQAGIGALAGLTGGSTGLNGPPVILFNLGTDQPVAVTRANLACFLTINSLGFLPHLWVQGVLPPEALWLGIVLLVPYGIGTRIGMAIFRPELAGVYRGFAYGLIGLAGTAALPIWS